MRFQFERGSGSLGDLPTDGHVPDFVVISGANGAGKSNLLTAIAEGALSLVDESNVKVPPPVRLFQLAELVVQTSGAQSPSSFRDRHLQLYDQVQSNVLSYRQPHHRLTGDALEQEIQRIAVGGRLITARALERLLAASGLPLSEMPLDHYRRYAPLITGVRDPFALSVNEIFLSYFARRNRNELEQWLVAEKKNSTVSPLTDEEFLMSYGPPPWELLDETLQLIGLDYAFVPPTGTEEAISYDAELIHLASGDRISMNQLSSGERTLLVIALTLYSSSQLGEVTELPAVLLLDEADASLHPSMIKSLLQIAGDVLAGSYGVKVIMTTHSPTTVALAPEASLYVMRRNDIPRLIKANRDEALASLTVGLPTLSVKIENRRQVFVESEYDETCYQLLFSLLRGDLDSPFSLDFIASGKGGAGDADAVTRLVTQLRGAGNASVWGIVDRDARLGAAEGVVFNAQRYAIENLVLDPLAVGVYLLRTGAVPAESLGLPPGLRHFQLSADHAEAISTFVSEHVARDGDDLTPQNVRYRGGFTASVPSFWMHTNGHDLEKRITDAFLSLRQERKELKARVIADGLADVPNYIPLEALDIFESLLRP